MELLPQKKPRLTTVVYVGALFMAVCSGVMGLYGYLWDTLCTGVAKTVARDFYLEGTDYPCTVNDECRDVCKQRDTTESSESCLCLKGSCHYVKGANLFSQAKFCEQDADCTVSCYEGPVGSVYFERAGGVKSDCSGGCAEEALLQKSDGTPNQIVCRHRQCRYADGRTCFISAFPDVSL